MTLTKEQLSNIIYKRKEAKSKVVDNLRQPNSVELDRCKTIVSNLMTYILQKHS